MENRSHALIAGAFVIIFGLCVLAAGYWFSGRGEQTRDYLLVTRGSVTGLNPQAQVRYRGIQVGKVEDIGIDAKDPRNILVRIRIDDDTPLTRGTSASLNSQGVTGLAYVMLDDDGSNLQPLDAPKGELPRIMMTPSMMDNLADALERASKLFDADSIKDLRKTIANVAAASDGLKEVPAVLASVRRLLSDENILRLQRLLAHLEKASGEVAPLAQDVRALVGSFQSMSRRIDQLGAETGSDTLPRLNSVLHELEQSTRELNHVLQQIDDAPQSLIFGRSPPSPGPGEAGYGRRP